MGRTQGCCKDTASHPSACMRGRQTGGWHLAAASVCVKENVNAHTGFSCDVNAQMCRFVDDQLSAKKRPGLRSPSRSKHEGPLALGMATAPSEPTLRRLQSLSRSLKATQELNHGTPAPLIPQRRTRRAQCALSLDCSSAHHLSYLATVARASLSSAAPSKPASLERLTHESITTSA